MLGTHPIGSAPLGALGGSAVIQHGLTSSLALSHTLTRVIERSLSSSLVLTSSALQARQYGLTHSLGLTDAVAKYIIHNLTCDNTITFSHDEDKNIPRSQNPVHSMFPSHQATRNQLLSDTITHTLVITQTTNADFPLRPNIVQSIELLDAASYTSFEQQDLVQFLFLADSVAYTKARDMVSELDLTDAHTVRIIPRMSFTDTLALTHQVRNLDFKLSNNLSLTHSVQTNQKIQTITHTMNLTQGVVAKYPLKQIISHALNIAQITSATPKEIARAHTLTITDSVMAQAPFYMDLVDSLNLRQEVSPNFTLIISNLCDCLSLSHRVARAWTQDVEHDLDLTHFVNPNPTIHELNLTHEVLTNILFSCCRDAYLPDKAVEHTLSLSHGVAFGGSMKHPLSSTLGISHVLNYFIGF